MYVRFFFRLNFLVCGQPLYFFNEENVNVVVNYVIFRAFRRKSYGNVRGRPSRYYAYYYGRRENRTHPAYANYRYLRFVVFVGRGPFADGRYIRQRTDISDCRNYRYYCAEPPTTRFNYGDVVSERFTDRRGTISDTAGYRRTRILLSFAVVDGAESIIVVGAAGPVFVHYLRNCVR